jgi:hypothetical protein
MVGLERESTVVEETDNYLLTQDEDTGLYRVQFNVDGILNRAMNQNDANDMRF